jgi:16S rRNA G966 N2-methylase RsmD
VPLFLSYQTRCLSIGVEYDEIIYSEAKKNLETAVYSMRTDVINQSAEEYPVPEEADRIFFFNPFSVQILKKVIENVRESYEKKEREILLFFYYPSKEYIAYLDGEAGLTREADIDCRDLLETEDERECVLVYRF